MVHVLSAEGRMPRWEAFAKNNERVYDGMLDSLEESGRLFIAGSGAYFSIIKGIEVAETRMVPMWRLPEVNKVRIDQWAGGIHHYAKVDDQDVAIDGVNKWKSRFSAEQAAKEWIGRRTRGRQGKRA